MSTTLPELIASRLVIPGPNGRPRIELGLVNGEPAIRLFDAEGNERVRLSLDRDIEEDPEYAGLAAELRLTATDDGGEVLLTAANAGNAFIAVSGERLAAKRTAAGAWIEANVGRLEASFYDPERGTALLQVNGRTEVRSDSSRDRTGPEAG